MKAIVLGFVVITFLCLLFFIGCKTWKASGRAPRGERLKKMEELPYFHNGQFQNLEPTVMLTNNDGLFKNLWNFLITKYPDGKPKVAIPSVKTDLKQLDIQRDLYVWLGHSSIFLQLDGKRYLIDPVLTYELPVTLFMRPYKGADLFSPADLPEIDYLIITHDHWDHLDYGTVREIRSHVQKVICGIGMGEDFEFWGYQPEQIHEMVWEDSLQIAPNTYIHCLPSRHFSGRLLSRNVTLWASYLIDGKRRIFISGDGGYSDRFQRYGERFPNIDLAFMENGQYNTNWRYIHLLPHLLTQAIDELAPRRVMAYHNSKFTLARHPWYEPLDSISFHSQGKPWELLTPRIGEVVYLDETQYFDKWWEEIK